MATGVGGRLVTATFADTLLHTLPGAIPPPAHLAPALDAWAHRRDAAVGPASSVRTIADAVVIPLLRILGFTITARLDREACAVLTLGCGPLSMPAVVVAWDESLRQAWRATVLLGIRSDARWCFCSNGRALRVVDGQHTWSREYLEFDLALLSQEPHAQRVLWGLVRADACAAVPPLLDAAVAASARHGVAVCRALGDGVLEALTCLLQALADRPPARAESDALRRPRRAAPIDAFEQSLTVLYRVLFLLFAEARGLVPVWHPVVPRALHHRIDRADAALGAPVSWRVAGGQRHLEARPHRLLRRRVEGHRFQRSALRASAGRPPSTGRGSTTA